MANIKFAKLAFTAVTLGMVAASLDFTIVSTALPAIQRAIHASTLQLQWIMNIVSLVMTMFFIAMGRFGDIFGKRRVFLFGIVVYALASLGAGLVNNAIWLILYRGIQALGTSMIYPNSLALVHHIYHDEEKRNKAIGIWAGCIGLSMALGPVLGGLIITFLSWQWIFLLLFPLGILSLILTYIFVPVSNDKKSKQVIDWWGLFLFALGTTSLLVGIIQVPTWGWLSMIYVLSGIIVLFIFYFVEQKQLTPMIHFKTISQSLYLSGALGGFVVLFINWPLYFLLPLYFYNIRHLSPSQVGWLMLIVPAIVAIGSPLGTVCVKWLKFKFFIVLACVGCIISSILFMFFSQNTSYLYIIVALGAFGLTFGLSYGTCQSAAMSVIEKANAGMASGALVTIRNIGGLIGLALGGAIFRYSDDVSLNAGLNQLHIQISSHMRVILRSLLSEPQKALQMLYQYDSIHMKSLHQLFVRSFLFGYRNSFILMLIVSIVISLIILPLLRKKS